MARLSTALLNLGRDRHRLLKTIPPVLSLLCFLAGVVWVGLLPLNEYSRRTYISENALLPGQVHTYFGGSEQNVFRAYREEIGGLLLRGKGHQQEQQEHQQSGGDEGSTFAAEVRGEEEKTSSPSSDAGEDVRAKIQQIFRSAGLKTATQHYQSSSSGYVYSGENIYSVLRAPRGDGTEAIVLVAALQNAEGRENVNGVALLLTLAQYFKRWSLWSKDIVFLVTSDSLAGPQAWIDAYHATHDPVNVQDLTLESGALQGAVCIDYPFDHRFETLHISYDGINGQLPNLDLFNTAVSIASGQMGIGTSIQHMHRHNDSYRQRLLTLIKGMSSQALGHATGPHSVFMPYHIDAITLTTIGEGWQDEMALGRTVESICRSLNNLLEHLHQSFFFYLLMQTNRFVSIGTYLPSAMAVAAAFTIMAITLWVQAGWVETTDREKLLLDVKENGRDEKENAERIDDALVRDDKGKETQPSSGAVHRPLALPIVFVTCIHFLGLVPMWLLNNVDRQYLTIVFVSVAVLSDLLPPILLSAASTVSATPGSLSQSQPRITKPQYTMIKSLSLLLLGLFLSALATLNFSLSMTLGMLCSPLALVLPTPSHKTLAATSYSLLTILSPTVLPLLLAAYFSLDNINNTTTTNSEGSPLLPLWSVLSILSSFSVSAWWSVLSTWLQALAFGWNVWGSWGVPVGIWCIWWPAWIVGKVLVLSSWFGAGTTTAAITTSK